MYIDAVSAFFRAKWVRATKYVESIAQLRWQIALEICVATFYSSAHSNATHFDAKNALYIISPHVWPLL